MFFEFLNEFGRSDKMRGLLSILLFFRIKLNTFNNTGERIITSICHITLKLLKIALLA